MSEINRQSNKKSVQVVVSVKNTAFIDKREWKSKSEENCYFLFQLEMHHYGSNGLHLDERWPGLL